MDYLVLIMVGIICLLGGTAAWAIWQTSIVDDEEEKGIKVFSHQEFPVHLEVSIPHNIDSREIRFLPYTFG